MTDDVLAGVQQAREAFAASHGYDLWAMAAALRRMDEEDDWPVVSLPPRPPEAAFVRESGGRRPDEPVSPEGSRVLAGGPASS